MWEHRAHAKGDVYCRFCGEMIARDVAKPLWHRKFEIHIGHGPARCGEHLTSCALMVLAGMREPVPEGTKKLPVEFRQDG